MDWMGQIAPLLREGQLVTDVGSTKVKIAALAQSLMPECFLPGHPMAGKESGGAALAEPSLFRGASWIFTPLHTPDIPRSDLARMGGTLRRPRPRSATGPA